MEKRMLFTDRFVKRFSGRMFVDLTEFAKKVRKAETVYGLDLGVDFDDKTDSVVVFSRHGVLHTNKNIHELMGSIEFWTDCLSPKKNKRKKK